MPSRPETREQPSLALAPADQAALHDVLRQLEAGWNALDGDGFAAPFAEDADFVTIRGEHFRGRAAVGSGHAALFRSIYADSSIHCVTDTLRLLRPDVALMHVRSELQVPRGPFAGQHAALFSMVLAREAGNWRIAAFHNTIQAPPLPPAAGGQP